MKMVVSLTLATALAFGTAKTVAACEFHGYIPDPTLVDILLGTEHVVVARPDPADPSRYKPTEALIGPWDITIPLAVSDDIRMKLSGDEAVLLAREEAYGPWLELAVMDPDFRAIVDQVMKRQSDWIYGEDAERFQMFAGLVNHPNPDIRELALRELDRADYIVLWGLSIPNVERLRREIEDVDDELRPIRILLAGLSGDQSYVDAIGDGLSRAVDLDLPYLGAYATALIELQGPKAVKAIVDTHFDPAAEPSDTYERLLEAFAIKNQTAKGMTRRAISQGVGQVLQASPELAGAAARQFGIRSDWSIADHIRQAERRHQPSRPDDVRAVAQYLEIVEAFAPER
ncbi:MAG: hypothetical protein AAFQ60_06035 [Pseudomonadota bacterium]